ncbi:sulfurtransferase complex subunit TusB [Pasteurellaceae bacterium HPA106]|uniref:sulfurtransferase complex subunit TusB n=1 Tax=Spirabiliibacterium pneumoniae TaxID=221400 RepID=UPI001AACB6CD|nr:sulfurtransferase complex subunit TusB [Spirabiliibacterium pneumoniae]MBE2897208.1 sulfurtransferase complex subunit TusB [Spirabiliibacterium pneumoniae]
MLYTFSKSYYPEDELSLILANLRVDDAVLLWQEGVMLAQTHRTLLHALQTPCYALAQDIKARNLTALFAELPIIEQIDMAELVRVSERFHPQLAL